MQGHLGAFLVDVDPAFSGLPTGRHEAACASGSIAILAASAEIEAGRYDCALVVGVEQMKTVVAGDRRRLPRHRGLVRARGQGRRVPVPEAVRPARRRVRPALRPQGRAPRAHPADQLRQRAQESEGADAHLVHERGARAARADTYNAVIGGRIKVTDCSQVTDGAVAVFLASETFAKKWAARRGIDARARSPRLLGWGHRTAPLTLRRQGRREPRAAVRAAAHAAGDHRRLSRAPASPTAGRSTASRPTTASRPPSTWRSITSGSPSPASRGRRSRRASSSSAASCRSTRRAGSSAAATPSAPPACASCSTRTCRRPAQAGDYQVEGAQTLRHAQHRRLAARPAACSSSVFDGVNQLVDSGNHVAGCRRSRVQSLLHAEDRSARRGAARQRLSRSPRCACCASWRSAGRRRRPSCAATLGLDAGYLSRLWRTLAARRLVTRRASRARQARRASCR